MLDWERNWRGAGVVFAAVLSGFLVMKTFAATAPDRVAVPAP